MAENRGCPSRTGPCPNSISLDLARLRETFSLLRVSEKRCYIVRPGQRQYYHLVLSPWNAFYVSTETTCANSDRLRRISAC